MSLLDRLRRPTRPPTSSIWEPSPPLVIDGRRRLNKQLYTLPKDRQEEERLRFQHQLLYTHLRRHYFAPLQRASVRFILDVGCGPGIWLSDMAALFPDALLTGVDSDERQRLRAVNTANTRCRLLLGDVLDGLPFPPGSFDFTHMRCMILAIPARFWPFVIEELVRVTVPGGFIELFDGGQGCERAGPNMQQMLAWGQQLIEPKGVDLNIIEKLGMMLRQTGGQDVSEQRLTIPLGTWGGRVGTLMGKDLQAIVDALKAPICTTLSLAPERFDVVVQALPQEWNDYHTTYTYIETHAQKEPIPRFMGKEYMNGSISI